MVVETSWFETQFRGIFAGLNYCIYSVIEWILQGLFDLASVELNAGLINDIYMKIYVFLGIFMTFKITVSLLKYMVNPDSINDKEKGASKLIARVITSLSLLILLPNLFPILRKVQTEFIPVLPKIILSQETDNSDSVKDNANLMATTALGAFFRPSEALDEADRPSPITSPSDITEKYRDSKNGIYEYDFNYVWALVAGVVIAIILISMTIKVGIRLFKMLILEVIAPIPVMSYIDPKSSKDGAFVSWTKQLTTTFLDIFVRLGIIYLVLMILSSFTKRELFANGGLASDNAYTNVFFIIALLMFAKDAPNFVKDALGIKHDKDTSGFLAGITGAATGFATGAVSGAISGRGVRGALTGAMTGVNAGFQGGMTGKKANTWQAAGDAAIQARTGDSKAKSGLMNAIQQSATKAQLRGSARKLNLTDDTIAVAKQNMIDMQGRAAAAERNWQLGINTGSFKDLDGNDITMEQAAEIVAQTSTASTIATKNYEKANKAGDTYGINRSFAEDYRKDQKDSKIDYRRGRITKEKYKANGQFNPYKGSDR